MTDANGAGRAVRRTTDYQRSRSMARLLSRADLQVVDGVLQAAHRGEEPRLGEHGVGVAHGEVREEPPQEALAEEHRDDREVEVAVAETDVAPVEHARDPASGGVVEDVLWLEVGVQQHGRQASRLVVAFVGVEHGVQA